MEKINVRLYLATSDNVLCIQVNNSITIEELCTKICRRLKISPIAQYLFSLRIHGTNIFLSSSSPVDSTIVAYDFRIRHKVPSLSRLKDLDSCTFNYYFHQVRKDVLHSKIPEIEYPKHKNELVGLGIADMYRMKTEECKTCEEVEKDYKKFFPKEVIKKHSFFTKKPIHNTLAKLQKAGYDAWYVKGEYLKQFEIMAPNYLSEEYEILYELEGNIYKVVLHIMPFHKEEPGLRVYFENKKEWIHICSIEELCFMSARNDGTLEISRKNGIPVYLKFMTSTQMFSFISCCDGYYRLMVKWTFNICKDVPTPSLQKLYLLKCHGPVGGEFSYHKLIEKRGYKPGCYILRQCEECYDVYYIDIFTKNSTKPETYKIEKRDGVYTFNQDPKCQYASIPQLISSYNHSEERIYLHECLPPSEYDKSPLLLCGEYHRGAPSRIVNGEDLESLLSQNKNPRFIRTEDLLLFKDDIYISIWLWTYSLLILEVKGKLVNVTDTMVCLLTHTGRGYQGHIARTGGGRLCEPWTTDRREANINPEKFPEKSLEEAKNYCRNPFDKPNGPWCYTSDPNVLYESCYIQLCSYFTCRMSGPGSEYFGPWCFVESEESSSVYEKEYCDINFCDYQPCEAFTRDTGDLYTHYVSYDRSVTNITFAIKMWTPDDVVDGYASIFLSTLDTPATRDNIQNWGMGIEITISCDGTENVSEPIYSASLDTDQKLMSILPLRYLSISGKDLLWNMPFCDSNECPVHTTSRSDYILHWPLKKTSASYDIEFSVRAVRSAYLKLVASPAAEYPRIVIMFTTLNNYTKVVYERSDSDTGRFVITEILTSDVINYHRWTSFTVMVLGDELQLHKLLDFGTHVIFKSIHSYFKRVRWFSCGSDRVIAHWSFFCKPPEIQPAWPPECVTTDLDKHYNGTHSNRTCIDWLSVPSKMLDQKYLNDTLFADNDMKHVGNNCRNPTRSITGTWCFTSDSKAKVDLCDVRDCDMAEEQTVILKPIKEKSKRYTYILPEWKFNGTTGGLYFSVKLWNPVFMGGLGFSVYPKDLSERYVLSIGANKNEKLIIEHDKDYSMTTIAELDYPRLVPTGKWSNLWLKMNRNGLELGYQGIEDDFFNWHPKSEKEGFEPVFLSYHPLENNYLGLHFTRSECKTERTMAATFDRLYSLGFCSDKENQHQTSLSLHIRGKGELHISLYSTPGVYNINQVDSYAYEVVIWRTLELHKSGAGIVATAETDSDIFNDSSWTRFDIEHSEDNILISRNGKLLVEYKSNDEPILYYWFMMRVHDGSVIWTANCDPPDIDAPPVDGGWGNWEPWQCSVSCGGGVGIRMRNCDSPKPSLFGNLCYGTANDVGQCNEFECGDLSDETLAQLRLNLQHTSLNIELKEAQEVTIPTKADLVARIEDESPGASIVWTRNGFDVDVNKTEILEDHTLVLTNVRWEHSGVYICFVNRVNDERIPLVVASVAVLSIKDNVRIRATLPYVLPCNCIHLAFIYTDLMLKITINDKVFMDYGITPLSIHESFHIEVLHKYHSGVWKFQIEHAYLGHKWITNNFKLHVLPAPNIFTHLRQDKLTSPFFGRIHSDTGLMFALVILIIFIAAMGILCTWFCLTFCIKTPLHSKKGDVQEEVTLEEVRELIRQKQAAAEGTAYVDVESKQVKVKEIREQMKQKKITTKHLTKKSNVQEHRNEATPVVKASDPYYSENDSLKPSTNKKQKKLKSTISQKIKPEDPELIIKQQLSVGDPQKSITDDKKSNSSSPPKQSLSVTKAKTDKSGTRTEGKEGVSVMYKAEWKVAQGRKLEVAMKLIKQDACDKYLKEFIDLAGRWAHLSCSSIVKLYGFTLRSPVSMIMEYMRYGPLDVYLRDKRPLIQIVDLVEASASLATALWHLSEAGVVHGNIRCRKMLVANHSNERFEVKLSDPGLHASYVPEDVHWLPIECFSNPESARKSNTADVWAYATTLWEIFSYGVSPAETNPVHTEKSYLMGHRLCIPPGCPPEMWALVRSAWLPDPHRRAQPQALMRDINHILYQVFNSRRTHSYATVFPKSFKETSIITESATSLFTNGTSESCLEALLSASDVERESIRSISSGFSGGSAHTATTDQDNLIDEDTISCDISTILSNLHFSSMNSTNSLDSVNSLQCIFELGADCNLVLQGRIGQGFYGEVFKGTLERDGETESRLVAVKKLKTTALSQMQDFEREISIMKTLKHRNIVEILGVIEEPEIQLIMEYIRHGSLQSYLKIHRHTVTVKHLLGYALDVALGMEYLGLKHVVHRDLAARNILVVAEEHVKISDFGLAQVMSKGDYYILKTNRDLPLKWYAPESVSDGKYSSRSDVWSYGVTLWEMFSYGEEPPQWGPNAAMANTLIVNSDSSSHLLSAASSNNSFLEWDKMSRLCCPPACPSEVYARLFLPCWNLTPHQRPTFTQLAATCLDIVPQY